eukprot:scaffold4145_cov115-Isochrysis_galbana.AAC.20
MRAAVSGSHRCMEVVRCGRSVARLAWIFVALLTCRFSANWSVDVAPMMVEVTNSREAQCAIASWDGVTLSRCLRATATYAATALGPCVWRNDCSYPRNMPSRVRVLGPLRGQDSGRQGRVGQVRDGRPVGVRLQRLWDERVLVGALEQRIGVLDHRWRPQPYGLGRGPEGEHARRVLIRQPPLAHLAGLDRLCDGLHLLVDGRDAARTLVARVALLARHALAARAGQGQRPLGPVQLHHVQVVRLQTRQRGVDGLAYLRLAQLRALAALAHPRVAVVVAAHLAGDPERVGGAAAAGGKGRVEDLRNALMHSPGAEADDAPIPRHLRGPTPLGKGAVGRAEGLLGEWHRVRLRRVEKVDSEIPCKRQLRRRLLRWATRRRWGGVCGAERRRQNQERVRLHVKNRPARPTAQSPRSSRQDRPH